MPHADSKQALMNINPGLMIRISALLFELVSDS
jgi:hypothetical protein